MNGRAWTADEDETLRINWPRFPAFLIAHVLGRGRASGYRRAHQLGLKKADDFETQPLASLWNGTDDPRSIAARFRPGSVPENKGLKRPGWAPGRMAATQFKKARPASESRNYVPIGAEKGQITAIEICMLTFEAAFLSHILLSGSQTAIEHVQHQKLLPPEAALTASLASRARRPCGRDHLCGRPSLLILPRRFTKELSESLTACRSIFRVKTQPFAESHTQLKDVFANILIPAHIPGQIEPLLWRGHEQKGLPNLSSRHPSDSLRESILNGLRKELAKPNQLYRRPWVQHSHAFADLLVLPRRDNFGIQEWYMHGCSKVEFLNSQVVDGDSTQKGRLPLPGERAECAGKNSDGERHQYSEEGSNCSDGGPVEATGRRPGHARNHHFCSDHGTISIWVRRHCDTGIVHG